MYKDILLSNVTKLESLDFCVSVNTVGINLKLFFPIINELQMFTGSLKNLKGKHLVYSVKQSLLRTARLASNGAVNID